MWFCEVHFKAIDFLLPNLVPHIVKPLAVQVVLEQIT